MNNSYTKFVKELAKISVDAPKGKAPKLLNSHLFVPSPFSKQKVSLDNMSQPMIKVKSEKYLESSIKSQQLLQNGHPSSSKYLTDIPLPKIMQFHVEKPAYTLTKDTGLTRILGFHLEIKGRRGTRTMKNVLSYGKLDRGSVGSSFVDFGRSHFVTKRGVTGVKVWINYGK